MAEMTPPRRLSRDNHYVSQAYLRRWASSDGRVEVFRTLVSHESVPDWRSHSLKGIAYHRHLYTQLGHGAESDVVERWLADAIDSPSEGVLSRVAAQERLAPADWDVLLRLFVASMARTPAYYFRRVPAWERDLKPMMERILKETVSAMEAGVEPGPGTDAEPLAKNVELPVRIRVRSNRRLTPVVRRLVQRAASSCSSRA
jgi:hypothetical protein